MSFRLLCDAIPFCYGPAAALEAFLVALFDRAVETPDVDVLATGSTSELLRRSLLPIKLLPIDSEDPAALNEIAFQNYDVFFNVCNPASFGPARRTAIPIVYLDFLLWMHTGGKPDYFEADLYLAENYPGTDTWIAERGIDIANLAIIPPLIMPPKSREPEPGFLLIGLGGLYSRLTIPGENNNYAPFVLQNVLEAIPPGRFSRVLIAGPSGLMPSMQSLLAPFPGAEYASLSHAEFVAMLSRSELFVSHPGLYAAFEAMLAGVPTFFLPPSNYTQVLQLRHYRRTGLAPASFSWEDAGLDLVPGGLPEAEGVRAILHVIANAERSPATKRTLCTALQEFFTRNPAEHMALGEQQRRIASSFGTDGPRAAADRFLQWVPTVRMNTR